MSEKSIAHQLPGAKILNGPAPWQVLQRDSDGYASVSVDGIWVWEEPGVVQIRVASEYDGSSVAGCDWRDAEMLSDKQWRTKLRIPTGGLYKIETRLGGLTGEKIWHIAVGDIWVIAGQSNAVGYGRGPVVDPPMLGVSLFGTNEEWRLATHPIFDPTGTKHPANYDPGWIDVSPWLTFGKVIYERAGVPVGLIPAALGGSPLCAWDPGSDNPFLFDNMNDMIEAAGDRVAGMVWYQGCSDTNTDIEAQTYLERFTRFIEVFRARCGSDLPVLTVQLNRHIDAPECNNQRWSMVREAQRQAALQISNLGAVPTLDLPLSDAIHTSASGNVMLGQRLGNAALSMAYGQDIKWQAPNLAEALFVDADRKTIKLRFEDLNGFFLPISANIGTEFAVEDAKGTIPLVSAGFVGLSEISLELSRNAVGKTVCHSGFGGNPTTVLRDINQVPILTFYGVEVN
ncbi:MAG: sialate O-acetylesterase [Armatimonadota bacterium]